ncbi:MAG: phosphate/phosphite/phosphonate ABC transporter substrate-binding protein [Zoogloea oleivorans]|jgi:phosphonate transport system substrate-binding protein|uniref:phosphate/phosphite/phosphonate ABC transporter substrate-binding protein n=1 Tax=Zoogloea oleivorans TaxID=1552750 RepID=UPI002A35F1FE|nr:phosphate/phosphite/phosphonate ABC transporter substrate-binding protein [Zoogloea oleivorans]MDY0034501.1 phosphate/phosphite/phosphonate ABC transporter substrate-binding protein [Zoogloea oleivorans]
MTRQVFLGFFLAFFFGISSAAPSATVEQNPSAFRVGIAPHTSARIILQMYQPLRAHLEKALGRPVMILTASDFSDFATRGLRQEFDLAVTTGHQARLFETDAGYMPMLTYKADFKAVILAGMTSPYREPKDLANSTVIGQSPSSLVTIWGQQWLHRNNIPNVQVRYASASDSVAQLVLNGEGSAGMMSLANYQSLKPEVRARLRILDESPRMAGRVYMLNKRNALLREKLNKALWSFAETPEALEYFSKYSLEGYRRLEPRELFEMEPYANEVRQALKKEK